MYKAISQQSTSTGCTFFVRTKNEKWEKTQHTVYMQLALIKSSSICLLGPFYGAFLFVFGKQKTKKPMCVCAHVSRLKCILDTTKQYCIKCLPCHPPTLSSPSKHRWKKGKVKRQSNQKRWQTNWQRNVEWKRWTNAKVGKVFGWHVRLVLRKMSTNLISDNKKGIFWLVSVCAHVIVLYIFCCCCCCNHHPPHLTRQRNWLNCLVVVSLFSVCFTVEAESMCK